MRTAPGASTLERTHGSRSVPAAVQDQAVFHGRWSSIERSAMKWETPEALDHRFGFEITMYISTR